MTVTRSFGLTVQDSPLEHVQGKIPDVTLGQAYSYQVPLVGVGAHVKSSSGPGWLLADATGKLSGTAPMNPAETVGKTLTIVVADAYGRTYTYVSPVVAKDIVEVWVKNEMVPASTLGHIWGVCPPEHPYVARFSNTFRNQRVGFLNDLAPRYINPGGVRISSVADFHVSTYSAGHEVFDLNPNEWYTDDQASLAKEITGNYMNWTTSAQHLSISMFCTSDKFGHGTTVYADGTPT